MNYKLSDIFINSIPSCEIIGYATTTKDEIPGEDGKILLKDNPAKVFKISDDGDYFQVVPLTLTYKEFFLVAYTNSSKFAVLEIQGQIKKNNPPPNFYPDYAELEKTINVNLIQAYNSFKMWNAIETDPWPIIVESGPLTDEEGDEIYYLGIKEKMAFISIIENEDYTFTIIVDQSKMMPPHKGAHDIEVYLNDSGHQEGDLYTMKITINIEIEKEEKPAETPAAVLDFLKKQKDKLEQELKDKEEKDKKKVEVIFDEKVEFFVPLVCETKIGTLG